MKNSMLTCALVAAVILALCPTGFAQGSLTPPGAPAPTMKSLDQIEPRTIVNAVNTPGDAGDMFVISQPGFARAGERIAGGGLDPFPG